MDALWILSLRPRKVRFLVAREYMEDRGKILRWILMFSGAIPIHEKDDPKRLARSLLVARKALLEGGVVGVFPEGRFTRTGHLHPFKHGLESIIRGTDAAVVPFFIEGGFRTRAGLGLNGKPVLFHPSDLLRRIYLWVGEPIESTESGFVSKAEAEVQRGAVEAARFRINSDGKVREKAIRRVQRRLSGGKNPAAIRDLSDRMIAQVNGLEVVARLSRKDGVFGAFPSDDPLGQLVNFWLPAVTRCRSIYSELPTDGDFDDQVLKKARPTILFGEAAFFEMLVQKILPESLGSVRLAFLFGGADSEMRALFSEKFGVSLLDGFFSQDSKVLVSLNVPDADLDGFCQTGSVSGTVGRPLPNGRVRIFDDRSRNELGDNRPGLIEIQGPAVDRGGVEGGSDQGEWCRLPERGRIDEEGFLTLFS